MMQTFLPLESFVDSATILDMRRLGKQRVEALTILKTLMRESNGWRNHPAVKMWAGYEVALATYGLVMCEEWKRRGYKDLLWPQFMDRIRGRAVRPHWLGHEEFHARHRAALLAKHWDHYKKFGWKEQPRIDYLWPEWNAPMPERAPTRPMPICSICSQPFTDHTRQTSPLFDGPVHPGCYDVVTEAARKAKITDPDTFRELWAELRRRKA